MIWITSPVRKDALSEARNSMTSATSRGSPRRFIRMLSFQLYTSLRSVAAWKGVSMVPGETMFTRMPNSAKSLARARE